MFTAHWISLGRNHEIGSTSKKERLRENPHHRLCSAQNGTTIMLGESKDVFSRWGEEGVVIGPVSQLVTSEAEQN